MLQSLSNFPEILESVRKGMIMGFLLGFGLGSFHLFFNTERKMILIDC